ncbi:MAG: hypothetical protein LBO66_06410 [Deltaproteobacteria bacterium]|jgi:hypothetical protein|nr:hypothetical protein [Deltaproteobacteria bacterium]
MLSRLVNNSENVLYHTRKLGYFVQFLDKAPKIVDSNGTQRETSELKSLFFASNKERSVANSVYLSSLFFWYFIAYSDCRNVSKREVISFPFDMKDILTSDNVCGRLVFLANDLLENLQNNSYMKIIKYPKYGSLNVQMFQPKLSKPITDEIDAILAGHYGFTEEELDYIINYDIKYRMGLGDAVEGGR